ncbi:hypothetical protein CC2G_005270 [Coprinopsis cinerea AmutBmut pab1-1]|nr:hypothetical protein CC2G_005270 [Coprinopsis cinerea AmutBmut pab1-1]
MRVAGCSSRREGSKEFGDRRLNPWLKRGGRAFEEGGDGGACYSVTTSGNEDLSLPTVVLEFWSSGVLDRSSGSGIKFKRPVAIADREDRAESDRSSEGKVLDNRLRNIYYRETVPLWQLWSPHSVKISATPEDTSCLFKPHFVVRASDGHPIVLDVHLPSLNRWTACSEQPCPNRYHEPSVHDWVYINSLKLNAESPSPVNQQAVEEFARNNPRTPPSETQPTAAESPETPYQAYRSANTSPAAKAGSFKLPDPDTDPEEDEEDDDEEEEEEVVQSLSVRSASPEQENTLPPFNTLHSALTASAPLISAQRLSSSGRSTPTNPASFVSRSIHPPLHTSRQLEDTSDAPSSEQKPPTSTQPTTLPSSTSQTTDDFTMSAADLAKLQEQQNQLTTAISTLVSHLTAAKTASSKSPVKAPEPFHGKAEDARRFLQFFTNWAGHQPQLKKDGNHGALRCNYCQRMGHAATVCQDKYMGFPPGRGLSRPPRRRVAATQEAPFSLFDEPAPAATATVAATTPAVSPAPAPTLASLSATQQQQLELLAQLQRLHQGF